jgi:AcrR family transcriptional regulator
MSMKPAATAPGSPPRISPRRAATRERLLTAARSVFAERGIQAAVVEDICEAAGFTRGAFYSNFASKQELFATLLRQEGEQLLGRLAVVVAEEVEAPPDGDVIDAFAERYLAAHPVDRQWFLVHSEFWLHAIRDPRAVAELNRTTDQFRGELCALLETALTKAGRRLVVEPLDAVLAVAAVFEAGIREMHLRSGARDPDFAQDFPQARRLLPLIIRSLSVEVTPEAVIRPGRTTCPAGGDNRC